MKTVNETKWKRGIIIIISGTYIRNKVEYDLLHILATGEDKACLSHIIEGVFASTEVALHNLHTREQMDK